MRNVPYRSAFDNHTKMNVLNSDDDFFNAVDFNIHHKITNVPGIPSDIWQFYCKNILYSMICYSVIANQNYYINNLVMCKIRH